MAATVGQGSYEYEVLEDWARVQQGWAAPMAAVAVDSRDRVYGFNRGEHGVIVFDKDGSYLFDWGETEFAFPHSICADRHDNIWIVDRNDGQVLKFTPQGELPLTIGKKGYRSDTGADNSVFSSSGYAQVTHAGEPFNLPAGVAVAESGEVFVADGYANCRVHKFDADGNHLLSWGEPGAGPGQFMLPHGMWIDSRGGGRVADRERDRVQGLTSGRRVVSQWPSELIGPAAVFVDSDGTAFVAEHNGGFFSVLTQDGDRITRWGGPQFRSCHGVAGDSEGSIYFVQPVEGRQGRQLVKYVLS